MKSSNNLDLSLLSPDSSYVCYSSADGGDPCSCRRSPRLLTNGYYAVTEDSFSWDDDGNVSLTPCKTNVSYKENLVRLESNIIYHTEVLPPPDKVAPPPKLLIQEEICSEICQSKETFTQSLGGLSEVPPPSPFYTNTCCCQSSPEHTGLTMKTLLLFIFTIFIFTALYSG
eukprot:superscaffoldBa00005614_g20570